ncbi:MAG: riboflavin biosynthesis protein RibF [Rhodospirillaceae bacterium]|nr:MAG: riboflavin biosynthesis protein RibF [Rhodospirillaceae bacterium]
MRILRHTYDVPPEAKGAVVAIGNFDGIHRGHRAVLDAARSQAQALATATAVLTFDPHPRSFFAPEAPPFQLTSLRDKAHALERLGIDFLIVRHFDAAFAARSAESFAEHELAENLQIAHAVTGSDFRFGQGRKGDAAMLQALATRFGFGYTAVAPVMAQGDPFSSTKIRDHLRHGRPGEAAKLLGRYWEITGRVEHGAGLGRDLGFPTANLALGDHLRPKAGIYAVRAGCDAGKDTVWQDGVAYLGTRPTFDGQSLRLEVNFFNAPGTLYGKQLRVQLIAYLREDATFADAETLKLQMAKDRAQAFEVLAKTTDPA